MSATHIARTARRQRFDSRRFNEAAFEQVNDRLGDIEIFERRQISTLVEFLELLAPKRPKPTRTDRRLHLVSGDDQAARS